ncbi:unnamed protein product [Peniophora sp. CBMAI 1063]|nr:unnamed protein product [Peniophora sp. CBMAI 1063]
MSLLTILLSLLAALALVPALYLIRQHVRQRSLLKIPGPPSSSWLKGNYMRLHARDAISFQDNLDETYGKVYRISGYFGSQKLVISDTTALHSVIVKNLDAFDVAEHWLELRRLLFGPGLIGVPRAGGVHAKHRKLMNPSFSVGTLKRLMPIFHSVCRKMREVMVADIKRCGCEETDVLEYASRGALELIGQAGFGYTFDAFEGGHHEFSDALKHVIPGVSRVMKFRPLLPYLTSMFPPWLLRRVGELLPMTSVREMIRLSDVMTFYSTSIWEEKKRLHTLGEKASNASLGEGRDILSVLLRENNKAAEEDRLPDEVLLAQVVTFLFAGTDTTSNALSRILCMLAVNPDAQDRLREELIEAGAPDADLPYEVLDHLPFLDAVCRETLRLHAPVRLIHRLAREDGVLPLQTPIMDVDGNTMSEIFVPKGTEIMCNVGAVNKDVDIWGSDAGEWKPERWLSPLPQTNIPGVLANTLTFSGGGRACIGFKFSLLELKAMLAQFVPALCFGPSTKHVIFWRYGSLMSSGLSLDGKPELPMRVSCV